MSNDWHVAPLMFDVLCVLNKFFALVLCRSPSSDATAKACGLRACKGLPQWHASPHGRKHSGSRNIQALQLYVSVIFQHVPCGIIEQHASHSKRLTKKETRIIERHRWHTGWCCTRGFIRRGGHDSNAFVFFVDHFSFFSLCTWGYDSFPTVHFHTDQAHIRDNSVAKIFQILHYFDTGHAKDTGN